MLDLFQLLSSPDDNWWTVDYCDVFIRLSFWRHPFTAEHPLLRHISTNLMKKQTHPNPGWSDGEHIFIFGWTVPSSQTVGLIARVLYGRGWWILIWVQSIKTWQAGNTQMLMDCHRCLVTHHQTTPHVCLNKHRCCERGMDFSMMNMRGWATGTELFIISTAICEYERSNS